MLSPCQAPGILGQLGGGRVVLEHISSQAEPSRSKQTRQSVEGWNSQLGILAPSYQAHPGSQLTHFTVSKKSPPKRGVCYAQRDSVSLESLIIFFFPSSCTETPQFQPRTLLSSSRGTASPHREAGAAQWQCSSSSQRMGCENTSRSSQSS